MSCHLDFVQNTLDIVVPVIKTLVGEHLTLAEHNYARKSVDLGLDALVNDHVTNLDFGAFHGDTHQLTYALEANSAVVLLYHSNIVLHQLLEESKHVCLVVGRMRLQERCVVAHLLFNLILL